MKISVISPCYNESENLELLHRRLSLLADRTGEYEWEFVWVDDCSSDQTQAIAERIRSQDPRLRVVKLKVNSGSHLAIRAGLAMADGDVAAVIAADLQDPPEMIISMLQKQLEGHSVVWAARKKRLGESASTLFFSKIYHFVTGVCAGAAVPPMAADAFLIERSAINQIKKWRGAETSVFLYIASLRLKAAQIEYEKNPRHLGGTKWTLKKKIKLFFDSIFMFGALPERFFLVLATIFCVLATVFTLNQDSTKSDRWILSATLLLSGVVSWVAAMVSGEYARRMLLQNENIEDRIE